MDKVSHAQTTAWSPPPSFRQKKSHKKSKNGCVTCKKRRVKCDESMPHCRVCLGRGMRCEYAGLDKQHTQLVPSILSTIPRRSCTTTESYHPAAQKLAEQTIPDALLWKYYLAHASKTIVASSTDPGHTRMWQESIPAVAFADPMVSHALMAFSAFCLSTSTCMRFQSDSTLATAGMHYCQSVVLLRTSLSTVDRTSADAVLACGMILIPCALALARSDQSVFSLQDWLYHLRGWRSVGSSIYGSNVQAKAVNKMIPYPQQGIPDPDDLPAANIDSSRLLASTNPLMDKIHDSNQRAITDLKHAIEQSSASRSATDIQAYLAAVTALEYILDYTSGYPVANLFRAIFIWAIQIPTRFIELLSCHDSLSLAIYAHWLVLTMALDDLWWVEGFGSGQIELLARQLEFSRMPDLKLLRWPIEMLEERRSMANSASPEEVTVR